MRRHARSQPAADALDDEAHVRRRRRRRSTPVKVADAASGVDTYEVMSCGLSISVLKPAQADASGPCHESILASRRRHLRPAVAGPLRTNIAQLWALSRKRVARATTRARSASGERGGAGEVLVDDCNGSPHRSDRGLQPCAQVHHCVLRAQTSTKSDRAIGKPRAMSSQSVRARCRIWALALSNADDLVVIDCESDAQSMAWGSNRNARAY